MSWSMQNGQYPYLTAGLPMLEQMTAPVPHAMWQTDGSNIPAYGCFPARAALGCFANTLHLRTLQYKGTLADWAAMTRGSEWAAGSSLETVICADGVVTRPTSGN